MSIWSSILLYLFVGVISYTLAAVSEKCRNKRKALFYAMLTGIVLSILPALRADSVGIDTALYMPKFTAILKGGNAQRLFGWDSGFAFIIKLLLGVFHSEQAILAIAAFGTNLLIVYRLYEFREYASFKICILLYYSLAYFCTYNIFKQFTAIAIVFYATRYIEKKKYIHFCLLVLLATMLHQSASLGFTFIAFNAISWKRITTKRLLSYFALLLMAPIAVAGAMVLFAKRINYYFDNISFNIGPMLLIRIAMLLFSTKWTLSFGLKDGKKNIQMPEEGIMSMRAIRLIYGAGLACASLGMIFPYMDRIGFYYTMYEYVYWAALYKKNRNNGMVSLFIIFALRTLMLELWSSGHGHVPYKFFFMD